MEKTVKEVVVEIPAQEIMRVGENTYVVRESQSVPPPRLVLEWDAGKEVSVKVRLVEYAKHPSYLAPERFVLEVMQPDALGQPAWTRVENHETRAFLFLAAELARRVS